MRYRKLDSNNDMVFGGGQSAFFVNIPQAVAQAAQTRLEFYVGDWFLDLADGTPWRTKVLGFFTGSTRDVVLRARMQGTPGLLSINRFSSALDRKTRRYTVTANLQTVYGQLPNAQLLLGVNYGH